MGSRLGGPRWADQLDTELRRLEELGFRAVEIHPESVEAIRNGRLDEKTAKKAADVFGAHDLSISVHVPGMVNLMHQTDATGHLDVLRASLQFAEAIGAEVFVYHPGRYVDEEELELGVPGIPAERQPQALQDEVATLRELAQEFKNTTIAMENACPYRGDRPYCYSGHIDLLKEQVQLIDMDNVRITLDLGHLYVASKAYEFDCVEAVRSIGPLIAHTHVHDNYGRLKYFFQRYEKGLVSFGMGDAHMSIGRGEIPIKDILAAYADTYRGMYMIELAGQYYEYAEESRDNLTAILSGLE